MIGQVDCFLDRCITPTDDHDILAAKKEPVASRAGRNAKAAEDFFARKAEPTRLRAGGQDDGIANINIAQIAGRDKRPATEIDLGDHIEDDPGADMLGLALHLLH